MMSGNDRSGRRCVVSLAMVLILAAAGGAWAADGSRIAFSNDLSAALRRAEVHKLPVVVYFTSPWCKWCRKMQVSTFPDRKVQAMAGKFIWVKIDSEQQPAVAAAFAVQGLPHVAVVDWQGRALDSRSGYMTAEKLAAFLRAAAAARATPKAADKIASELESVGGSPGQVDVPTALRTAVEHLARPDRQDRRKLRQSMHKVPAPAWRWLCVLMEDKHLAIRAAAGEALADVSGQSLPFDPFAPPARRARQVAAWRDWIRRHRATPTARQAGEAVDAPTRGQG